MDVSMKPIYAKFTKKDDDQRTVEGYASTEAVDSQGEIVKSNAIENALKDYMVWGNLREMHQWSAVGKTISAKMDKVKKGLYITGKIIDKEAWEKVKEGVYNGFSIGGKVIKRVNNTIEALTLNEISLVDRPANPEAVFTMVKMDKEGKMIETQSSLLSKGAWDARILASMIVTLEDMLSMSKEKKNTKMVSVLNSAITALKKVVAHEIMEPTKDSMEEGKDSPMAIMMADFEQDLVKNTHYAGRLIMMIQTLEQLLGEEKKEEDDIAIKGISTGIASLKEAAVLELNEEEKEEDHSKTVQAESILSLAEDMRKTLNLLEASGRSTLSLGNALTALKTLAGQTLSKEDKEKFDTILYRMDFKELEKTKIPQIKTEQEEEKDIKKFVDHNWTSGYFEDLRKVI